MKEWNRQRQMMAGFERRVQHIKQVGELHKNEFVCFRRTAPDSDRKVYMRKVVYFLKMGDWLRQTLEQLDLEFDDFEEETKEFIVENGGRKRRPENQAISDEMNELKTKIEELKGEDSSSSSEDSD